MTMDDGRWTMDVDARLSLTPNPSQPTTDN